MKKAMQTIFSLKRSRNHKILTILGIKIKFKSKIKRLNKKTIDKDFIKRLQEFDIPTSMNSYNMLSDDYSKETFINVLKYRLSRDDIFLPPVFKGKDKEFSDILALGDKTKVIEGWNHTMNLYNLSSLGKNINVYSIPLWIYLDLVINQYEYNQGSVNFKVNNGDYVIDGGAFYADNTLIFAHDVGENGKVFSFEFMPENTSVWHKNVNLNPELSKRITLIEKALWSDSKSELYVGGTGPESYCSDKLIAGSKLVKTICVDDFVEKNNIEKIDFIKLDIEGAELPCLKGAQKTIKKFKPRLALCVYHKDDDLITIPQYVKSLVPEYKMYLKHHTDGIQETVLYCEI